MRKRRSKVVIGVMRRRLQFPVIQVFQRGHEALPMQQPTCQNQHLYTKRSEREAKCAVCRSGCPSPMAQSGITSDGKGCCGPCQDKSTASKETFLILSRLMPIRSTSSVQEQKCDVFFNPRFCTALK